MIRLALLFVLLTGVAARADDSPSESVATSDAAATTQESPAAAPPAAPPRTTRVLMPARPVETDIVHELPRPAPAARAEPARWQLAAGLGVLASTDASTDAFSTSRALPRWGASLTHAPDGFAARLAYDLQYALAASSANDFGALSVSGAVHTAQLGVRVGLAQVGSLGLFARPALSASLAHLAITADAQMLSDTAFSLGLAGTLGAEWRGAGNALGSGFGLVTELGYDWQFIKAQFSGLGPDVESGAKPERIPLVAADAGQLDASGLILRLGALYRF